MEIPAPIVITIIAGTLFIVWQIYQRKINRINQMGDIPPTLRPDGFEIPVLATFTGQRDAPRQLTKSHNSLNPSFILYEDRLECRVLLKQTILLSEIDYVDIWETFGTRNLQIYVKGEKDMFTANLFNRRNLARVLNFLKKRGVPLSERSQNYLSR